MPDISNGDLVVVRTGGRAHVLGDHFASEEAVEEAIEERFDAGSYTYGVVENVGSYTVLEDPPEPKTFTDAERRRLDAIEERAEDDDRIEGISVPSTNERQHMCSFRLQRIRYDDGQVDFSMRLANDHFDDVPVSTISAPVEETIEGIFADVTDGNATYLGYESTYASRGRKNPFVRVYGRVKRERKEEQELRTLQRYDPVEEIYWSEENLSAVRILVEEPTDEHYEANDYIVVLDSTQDGYEEVEDEERVKQIAEQIEAAHDFPVQWIGALSHERTYSHICLGLRYDGS